MLQHTTAFAISLLIIASLVVASLLINSYIARRVSGRRGDGQTAFLVAIGCAYMVIGASAVLMQWAQ